MFPKGHRRFQLCGQVVSCIYIIYNIHCYIYIMHTQFSSIFRKRSGVAIPKKSGRKGTKWGNDLSLQLWSHAQAALKRMYIMLKDGVGPLEEVVQLLV